MESTINTIIFDLDDTLIDWSGVNAPWSVINFPKVQRVYDYLAAHNHAIDVDRDEFAQIFGRCSEKAWTAAPHNGWRSPQFETVLREAMLLAGVPVDDVDMQEAMEAYCWNIVPGVKIFPDTIPVLTALRSAGFQIGLVTNAYFPMWMRDIELEAFGIKELLDARITSGDTGWLKPHPAVFWRMLGMLDTTPANAVFVGDSPVHDIAGANDVGMISVLHAPPGLNRPLGTVEPDYTIASLTELLTIVTALGQRKL